MRFEHSVHYCTGLYQLGFPLLDRPNVGEMNSRSTCACRARARERVARFRSWCRRGGTTCDPSDQPRRLNVNAPRASGPFGQAMYPASGMACSANDDRLIQPGSYEKIEVENLNLRLTRGMLMSRTALCPALSCPGNSARQFRRRRGPLKTAPVFRVLGLNSRSP